MSRRRFTSWMIPSTLALATCLMAASPAAAQYFGRNKVQYETFDFRILKTPHYDVYFYPEEEAATRDAARMAERWYSRLSTILDHQFTQRQPVVIYGSGPAFQQTTTLSGEVGEGTGGVTEALQQRVILPLTGSYAETDHVLGHELVHAFQYDISGLGRFRGSPSAGARALGGAPLWFTEGMAEYLSIGAVDPLTAMWLRDAVLTGDVPSIDELTNNPNYFPYRWGQALWAYIGGRWGDATIGQILQLIGQGIPYEQAFERVLNIKLDDLSEDWHVSIRRSYLPLLAERPEAREVARPLITQKDNGGSLNVAPVVSPDGRWIAFLSERDIDIDLWLANARTGEVVRRLQKGSAFDTHFQSLRFINSAGTFSPDSKRFAFSAQRGGHDVLAILNVDNGNLIRELTIPRVSEISAPSWSPDGRTIVVSGVSGGVSDLYTLDPESGASRQLTQDLFANLHPSFSPDGRTIAFVTDQGPGADFATLQPGPYRIALMDANGSNFRIAPSMEGANINPTWTRDGRGLYFISDRTGIPNIYRVELESGQLFQLTKLFGGVSGITRSSPAISAARDADRLVFTSYEKNGYNIYALTTTTELAGTPVSTAVASGPTGGTGGIGGPPINPPLPAQLPPAPRPPESAFNRVATLLVDPNSGLPSTPTMQSWAVAPYRSRLLLEYVGQPQVGYSTGGVLGQGGLYGGISGIFSDVLGYNNVQGTVLAQGALDEIGFAGLYLNQKHRWNWGTAAERIPYITAYQSAGYDAEPTDAPDPGPGNPTVGLYRQQIQKLRYFNSALEGLAQYPFSQVRRLELSGGARRISTDVVINEIRTPVSVAGGVLQQIGPSELVNFKEPGSQLGYNLAEASVAYVFDNALGNYTSPFAGQRYRFELTPTVGDKNYVQTLVDYRKYQFLRPFTLAVQGMHFARYGLVDQPDQRLFYPVFIGQPSFVRGYYSVYSECYNNPSTCDLNLFNNLFGSRIAVAKAELRFPLVRALVVGPGIGFPPIEGFGFYDAGVAWGSNTTPTFSRGVQAASDRRGILSSAGFGGRVNLLGYAVLEVDYVRAFERDQKWRWQFALQPGF